LVPRRFRPLRNVMRFVAICACLARGAPRRTVNAEPAPDDTEQSSNVLFILLDQLRYDALGYVQRGMPKYSNKVTVRTPHMDLLASRGASFATMYAQSASCAPSRASVKTGCTVARHGLIGNKLIEPPVYNLMESFRSRITQLTTYEQVLSDERGYAVETYGKWHFPEMYYGPVRYNDYNYQSDAFEFRSDQVFSPFYQDALKDMASEIGSVSWTKGDQVNPFNDLYPYTPLPTDPRYAMPTRTTENVLPAWLQGEQLGTDALAANYTSTAVVADMAYRALDRLLTAQAEASSSNASSVPPFLLSVHFNAPVRALHRFRENRLVHGQLHILLTRALVSRSHSLVAMQHPPRIVTGSYLRYYQRLKKQLFVPPSVRDSLKYSPYQQGRYATDPRFLKNNATYVQDLTSVYYGMVEEVDAQIGRLLRRLEQDPDVANNTLVVLTSDHGEMLGSHGMTGKGNLFEESTRVPLILVHPAKIAPNQVVNEPVTHLDLFSTILDYSAPDTSHASELLLPSSASNNNSSDGVSLRRYVDRTSCNQDYDERAVVVELDGRVPLSATTFAGALGGGPNFLVRRGPYKLLITRKATGPAVDALWNLASDPYEMNNLLRTAPTSPVVIGKAEHLRILLVEWLRRHDTELHVYTSNYYHGGEGRGDVAEVSDRRTWKRLSSWQSDARLGFGIPAKVSDTEYRRHEYLYVGGNQAVVSNVTVEGPNATYFSASAQAFRIGSTTPTSYFRIQVRFAAAAQVNMSSLLAYVVVRNGASVMTRVPIYSDP
jgi:arylsulfatase A-like enzyme